MNRLALALLVALAPLVAATSASACGMYRPTQEAELLMAKSLIERGDAALARKELRSAVRQYNRAMSATGPRNIRATAAIKAGEVYAQLGRAKHAVRRFKRAVRIAPFFSDGHQALGFALIDAEPQKAIVHLEGALAASDQGTADTHAGLAIAYARTGDAAKAKSHLQNARLKGASAERIIAAEKVMEQGTIAAVATRT